MSELCDGCVENVRVCYIKSVGGNAKDCPCLHCLVKMMCSSGCSDWYGLTYGTGLKGKK